MESRWSERSEVDADADADADSDADADADAIAPTRYASERAILAVAICEQASH